jgi:hypothetical protein
MLEDLEQKTLFSGAEFSDHRQQSPTIHFLA